MVRTLVKIGLLGALAILGIALAIPTSLTSLILTGFAIIGVVAVLLGAVLR